MCNLDNHTNMTTLFISDLHLSEAEPHLTQLFEFFIRRYASKAQQLYILGDLFDFWLGDDISTPYHHYIAELLQNLSKEGVSIFFLSGNRDFLLSQLFASKAGFHILKEPHIADIYGHSVILVHGDRQCTDDQAHQLFRNITDYPWVQNLFLSLPANLRLKIAMYLRKKSQRRFDENNLSDIHSQAVKALFQAYAGAYLIHGHVHNPCIELKWNHFKLTKRIGLSDWGKKGHFLQWNVDGSMQLQFFGLDE